MDENRLSNITAENNRQIQLVVNQAEQETIDLGRILRNIKKRRRLFIWVLVLSLTAGVCAGLLWYQFTKAPLTVSSVVTLRYNAPVKIQQTKKDGSEQKEWIVPEDPEYSAVSDLSAPNGTALDVNQITSSYVLQSALNGMNLPETVTVSNVRANIRIQTFLTDESRRTKESLAGLAEIKNADAYKQLNDVEMKYQNRFVVTLQNGFGDEESRVKTELENSDLKLLLDRILSAYNDYLVRTYADVKLPGDTFSMIDIQTLDAPESLDRLRNGIDELYNYCNEKTDTVKAYRSWQTGWSLQDWMEALKTYRSISLDSLAAVIKGDGITRNKHTLFTGWRYSLRTAQNELDRVNGNIAEMKKILANYKNDEVFISMQESDTARSTRIVTDYYNELILQIATDQKAAAELKTVVADYENRISQLETAEVTAVTEEVEEQLSRSVAQAQTLYEMIRAHMEEVLSSPMFTTYEEHSAAQGKEKSFITASMKKVIVGGILGAIIACGLWFLAALVPELVRDRKEENGKEAPAK